MLRTSLRIVRLAYGHENRIFLSSNAQDFIEDARVTVASTLRLSFLSSNAQDFIEDARVTVASTLRLSFLSSNAQDFIEDITLFINKSSNL